MDVVDEVVDSNVCACWSNGSSCSCDEGDDGIVRSNSRDRLLLLVVDPLSAPSLNEEVVEEFDASECRFRDGNKYSIAHWLTNSNNNNGRLDCANNNTCVDRSDTLEYL